MRAIITVTTASVFAALAFAVQAQMDPTRESMPAPLLSTTLGLTVSPAKNQTRDQQASDETECYAVSKQQTGVDPFTTPAASASQRAEFDKAFTGCLAPRGYTVK
jgi:hypothetical protein